MHLRILVSIYRAKEPYLLGSFLLPTLLLSSSVAIGTLLHSDAVLVKNSQPFLICGIEYSYLIFVVIVQVMLEFGIFLAVDVRLNRCKYGTADLILQLTKIWILLAVFLWNYCISIWIWSFRVKTYSESNRLTKQPITYSTLSLPRCPIWTKFLSPPIQHCISQ